MRTLFESPSSLEISSSYDRDSKIVLYGGDCRELLSDLPSGSVDLIITSPPYNVGKKYENATTLTSYLEHQEEVIDDFVRVISESGSICWQVGNYVEKGEVFPLDIFYYAIFKSRGMKLRNRIIWRFNHGLHASKRFSGRYEVILWFTKSDDYIFNLDDVRVPSKYPGKRYYKGPKKGQLSGNPLGKNPSDIWDILAQDWESEVWDIPNVKSNHSEKTDHPCQFPIELVERCVLALTHVDGTVLDPYCGVGSSLIAAMKHNRKAIGAESDSGYIEIAKDRIRKFQMGDLSMRPLGKPIHQPSGREKVAQRPLEWGPEA